MACTARPDGRSGVDRREAWRRRVRSAWLQRREDRLAGRQLPAQYREAAAADAGGLPAGRDEGQEEGAQMSFLLGTGWGIITMFAWLRLCDARGWSRWWQEALGVPIAGFTWGALVWLYLFLPVQP